MSSVMQASDMDIDEGSSDNMDIAETWPEKTRDGHDRNNNSDSDQESDSAPQIMENSPKNENNASTRSSKRPKLEDFDMTHDDDESDEDTKVTSTETGISQDYPCDIPNATQRNHYSLRKTFFMSA